MIMTFNAIYAFQNLDKNSKIRTVKCLVTVKTYSLRITFSEMQSAPHSKTFMNNLQK